MRRLRPWGAEAEVAIAVAWMVGQAVTFLRDADYWSRPPFSVALDAGSLDGLDETRARLCLGGLAGTVHLTEI